MTLARSCWVAAPQAARTWPATAARRRRAWPPRRASPAGRCPSAPRRSSRGSRAPPAGSGSRTVPRWTARLPRRTGPTPPRRTRPAPPSISDRHETMLRRMPPPRPTGAKALGCRGSGERRATHHVGRQLEWARARARHHHRRQMHPAAVTAPAHAVRAAEDRAGDGLADCAVPQDRDADRRPLGVTRRAVATSSASSASSTLCAGGVA